MIYRLRLLGWPINDGAIMCIRIAPVFVWSSVVCCKTGTALLLKFAHLFFSRLGPLFYWVEGPRQKDQKCIVVTNISISTENRQAKSVYRIMCTLHILSRVIIIFLRAVGDHNVTNPYEVLIESSADRCDLIEYCAHYIFCRVFL